jgi:transcriptional regulator with XRE-family HTH domain
LGFFGLPVSHWRPDLSSLFPEFYDRALEQLVLARRAARITQAVLAETLGRPQSFVAKYESGERRLDAAEFVGIARALGADPFKLLTASEKRQS